MARRKVSKSTNGAIDRHKPFSQAAVVGRSHPAMRSGPSPNPKLRLMGLPVEVRAKIYPYLLLKAQYLDRDASAEEAQIHVTATRGTQSLCRKRGQCKERCWFTESTRDPCLHCSAVGPPGTISVLLACRQMYTETVQYLYSRHAFVTQGPLQFSTVFINHAIRGIGFVNARSIRSLTILIGSDLRVEYSLSLRRRGRSPSVSRGQHWVADIVCRELPGLQMLMLKSADLEDYYHGEPRMAAGFHRRQERRCMLSFAAYITDSHPVLRKAVWRAWHGVGRTMEGHYADPVEAVWPEIKITAAGETEKMSFGRRRDTFELYLPSRETVLDCAKIRRTSLRDRAYDSFELSRRALSSEPEATETARGKTHAEGTGARFSSD